MVQIVIEYTKVLGVHKYVWNWKYDLLPQANKIESENIERNCDNV